MSRSVAIIGCGWLGSALASRLVASGVRVVGTSGSREGAGRLASIGVEALVVRFAPHLEGDVAALQDVEAIVVAIPPGRGLDPVAQARAVASVIAKTRASHVVQISTTSVYPSPDGRVTETDAIEDHPLHRVEHAYKEEGRPATILRCAGLYGTDRLILPFVLRAGVVVDEHAPVNLVAQSDVVNAILSVLDAPVADTFNVCADEHPTKGEFYRELAKRTGLDAPRFGALGEPWKIVDNRKFRERFRFRYVYPDPLTFPV